MSSQGMLVNSVSVGSCWSVSWFVGVLWLGSSSLGCCRGVVPVGVVVVVVAFEMSCVMSCGVSGAVCTCTCGQVVAKHLGCHDSPQLCVFRIRHSRPLKSWLQTVQDVVRSVVAW